MQRPNPSRHPVDSIIAIWDTSFTKDTTTTHLVRSSSGPSPSSLLSSSYKLLISSKHYIYNNYTTPKFLISLSTTTLAIYVLFPTIFPSNKHNRMFSSTSKRPDKNTTGMINMTTDCFANSSLQALAALPGLNVYLNEMILMHSKLTTSLEQAPPSLTLHLSLVDLLARLQEVVYFPRVISVWDFLHTLERIYKSKISRNQHDAHELTQLILETMFMEYSTMKSFIIKSKQSLPGTATDEVDKLGEIPQFPFRSEQSSSLRCMRCGKKSSTNYNPTMIMSLVTPQDSSIDLESLLKRSESETIDDYSCLRCKINFILSSNNNNKSEFDVQMIEKLKMIIKDDTLLINDDLPVDIDDYINSYPEVKHPQIKSTVHKVTNIILPPKILPIHLSRSIFLDNHTWRNACNVNFNETLTLKVDGNEMEMFKKRENEELEKSEIVTGDGGSIGINNTDNASSHHMGSILVYDDKASDEFKEVRSEDDLDSDANIDEGFPSSNDDIAEDDDVEDNLEEEITPPPMPEYIKNQKLKSSNGKTTSPMTSRVLTTNDNDNYTELDQKSIETYTYKLRAVIRHQGSHSLGHYECYRRKPVFYKNATTGTYYPVFPTLKTQQEGIVSAMNNVDISGNNIPTAMYTSGESTDDLNPVIASSSGANVSDSSKSRQPSTSALPHPQFEPISEHPSSSVINSSSNQSDLSVVDNGGSVKMKRRNSSFSKFKSRMSGIASSANNNSGVSVSSSGSGVNKPRSQSISEESVNFSVMGTNNVDGYDSRHRGNLKKDKKLASSVKHPFWRISDSKISECSQENVLRDSKAVYMIFYERVD